MQRPDRPAGAAGTEPSLPCGGPIELDRPGADPSLPCGGPIEPDRPQRVRRGHAAARSSLTGREQIRRCLRWPDRALPAGAGPSLPCGGPIEPCRPERILRCHAAAARSSLTGREQIRHCLRWPDRALPAGADRRGRAVAGSLTRSVRWRAASGAAASGPRARFRASSQRVDVRTLRERGCASCAVAPRWLPPSWQPDTVQARYPSSLSYGFRLPLMTMRRFAAATRSARRDLRGVLGA